MPAWQVTPVGGACGAGPAAKKATADLAAAASFTLSGTKEGIALIQAGTWYQGEGTSASSPIVAGIFTRLGLAVTVSNNLGWVYTNAQAVQRPRVAELSGGPGRREDRRAQRSVHAAHPMHGRRQLGRPLGGRLAERDEARERREFEQQAGSSSGSSSGSSKLARARAGAASGSRLGGGGKLHEQLRRQLGGHGELHEQLRQQQRWKQWRKLRRQQRWKLRQEQRWKLRQQQRWKLRQ